jgi:hypothetical protein
MTLAVNESKRRGTGATEPQEGVRMNVGREHEFEGVSLRDLFSERQDPDFAACLLAKCFGLFPGENFRTDTKAIFLFTNPLGTALYEILDILVRVGVLDEADPESGDVGYRWVLEDSGHSLADG